LILWFQFAVMGDLCRELVDWGFVNCFAGLDLVVVKWWVDCLDSIDG
jgi:hypothetical protein